MADTAIEWTDTVWNPTTGCDRVSPGCDNCYALTMAKRLKGMGQAKYQRDGDPRTSGPGFGVSVHPDTLDEPLHWRKPRRVFVNSMSDLFHDTVPDEFIAQVFARMWWSPQHTFQVLTKRHGRMRSLVPRIEERLRKMERDLELVHAPTPLHWPLRNVWLGVSVENQRWADIRIPALLETPAAVRFLSCEPLLGPVDLRAKGCPVTVWDGPYRMRCGLGGDGEECSRHGEFSRLLPDGLHWLIVGGESGSRARPMHPDWARSLRDQAVAADVPFFLKQWGEWGPAPFIVRVCDPDAGWHGSAEELAAAKADSEARGATHVHTGHSYEEDGERRYWLHEIGHKPWSLERVGLPDGTAAIRRWGKKHAGRELDGRTWDQFPEPAEAGESR